MATAHPAPASPSERPDEGDRTRTLSPADDESLLAVLSDEYTRQLLEALSLESRPARALVEATDMSRPTVYRRLNRLEEHGLVRTDTEFHPDGHHRNVFEATLDSLALEFDGGTPTVELVVDTGAQATAPAVTVAAD